MKRAFGTIALLGCLLGTFQDPALAVSLTTLKQVQITNGSQVDLLFDGKISKDQIRTEFFNDIIQVSLTDAAVYPAKISSVNGDAMTKIFAYQYAPRLVRCRISVKGKAEDFKDAFAVKPSGKMLTLKLGAGVDSLTLQSSAPLAAPKSTEIKISESEERALLEKVLKAGPAPAPIEAKEPAKETPKKRESASKESSSKEKSEVSKSLTSGKPLPSLWGAFGKLAIVLGIFLAAAFAFRKYKTSEFGSKSLMSGAIARFAKGKLGGSSKMIEIISTQYLGPKQSIAVVKISGRTMVLGISQDSINLISQLGGEADLNDSEEIDGLLPAIPTASTPAAGTMAAGTPRFSDLLGIEATKPQARVAPQGPSMTSSNEVRERIKSRLEGFKTL
jgi:flagellar biogenesis protein FliO